LLLELEGPLFYIVNILVPLLGGYLGISIGEHQLHRHLMHRKRLPKAVYTAVPYALALFTSHAVNHHAHWYREFDFEPDEFGKLENLNIGWQQTALILLGFGPLLALVTFLSPLAGIIAILMIVAHNRLWNVIHNQMHVPKDVFFRDSGVYRYLARNHFMHHVKSHKNYNVVFPAADVLFGTKVEPALGHLREMLRLGYLVPRSAAGRRRLEKAHVQTAQRRTDMLRTFVSSMTAEQARIQIG